MKIDRYSILKTRDIIEIHNFNEEAAKPEIMSLFSIDEEEYNVLIKRVNKTNWKAHRFNSKYEREHSDGIDRSLSVDEIIEQVRAQRLSDPNYERERKERLDSLATGQSESFSGAYTFYRGPNE